MLPKKRRLSAPQVREVLAFGKSLRGGSLSLKYLVKPGLFGAAAIAPKAVARRAVDRNRLRRTLYRTLSTLPPTQKDKLHNMMAVFFIRDTPSPLASVFKEDIVNILTKLPPHV